MTPGLSPRVPAINRQHIVNCCSEKFGNYIVPCNSPTGSAVFVKRGTSSLKDEARTQSHFYRQAQLVANAPRVPQVYDVFDDGCGSTYLVMEFVPAPTFEAWINTPDLSASERGIRKDTAIRKVADAVTWLLKCPPPGKTNRRVELTEEPRLCCPSDVSLRNFLWGGNQIWFIDWQHVNVLPHSFASYYFHCNTDKVVQAVAALINLQPSTKLNLIKAAASIVIQAGIPDWGLDEYGNEA